MARFLLVVWPFVAQSSALGADSAEAAIERQPGYLLAEYVPETPYPFNHASTIVETRAGLLAAWVSGSKERLSDVSIWISRQTEDKPWSAPVAVAEGVEPEKDQRFPCWNPVLFRPKQGPLFLFYKVGPDPERWWGMMTISYDDGRTWTRRRRLPEGIYGPIRNKPVSLADGTILCGSSTEDAGWRVHMERTRELGSKWTRTGPLNTAREFGAIQPTILARRYEGIQILCRSKQGAILQSFSQDNGKTWTPMERTSLPNPNSAIDAVLLKDERALLIYNHSATDKTPLNVAVSKDGHTWRSAVVLENQPGQFSYPAVIQAEDGLVHITYTWNKERIKHVVLDPEKIEGRLITDGR